MKISKSRIFHSSEELCEYIRTIPNTSTLEVSYDPSMHYYKSKYIEELTEAEFNMQNLQDIAKENELSMEQFNAIDYGISAIKTLVDMGVLK